MRTLKINYHHTSEELEKKYRAGADAVERSQWQIVWLLSQGRSTTEVGEVTGYSLKWIRTIAHRYSAEGAQGIGDGRHHNPGKARLLSTKQAKTLDKLLAEAVQGQESWNGPQVASWMSEQLGRPVHAQRGWEMLQRLGYSSRVPRPRHAQANQDEQRVFKKSSPPR